jgi:thioredoxin 1
MISIINITKENFINEIEKSDKLTILSFLSELCNSCKAMTSILEEIEEENRDIKICKIDVNEELEMSQKFSIMSIPTSVIIKDNKVLGKIIGYKNKKAITKIIKKYI